MKCGMHKRFIKLERKRYPFFISPQQPNRSPSLISSPLKWPMETLPRTQMAFTTAARAHPQ